MKNKKGFTLVELIAVIAILAILVIVVAPGVLNGFNKGKEGTIEIIENNVTDAAKLFMTDTYYDPINTDLKNYGNNNIYTIKDKIGDPVAKYICIESLENIGSVIDIPEGETELTSTGGYYNMSDVKFGGNVSCKGFVVFEINESISNAKRKFSDAKTYLSCEDAYKTPGYDEIVSKYNKTDYDTNQYLNVSRCGLNE